MVSAKLVGNFFLWELIHDFERNGGLGSDPLEVLVSGTVRNGQSTVGGPKWTKMDLFRPKPKWTKMDHLGPFWSLGC